MYMYDQYMKPEVLETWLPPTQWVLLQHTMATSRTASPSPSMEPPSGSPTASRSNWSAEAQTLVITETYVCVCENMKKNRSF